MRTKTLLAAAAFVAAGIATSMAQSNVYSLNVVGYVNKSFQQFAFAMVSNPLKGTTDNLSTIIPTAPDGTAVYTWNVALQDLNATIPTYVTGTGWTPDAAIAPGQGFFVAAGDNFTNTFVGEVRQGADAISLVGGLAFEAIGSVPAIGGSVSTVLANYPATDGDALFFWNVGTQDIDATIPTFVVGTGWVPYANIPGAEGFFLSRQGGPVTWNRNFTVQ
jgi:hypothetical protein